MVRKVLDRLLQEPEAMTMASVAAGMQAVCPGVCTHCAVPVGIAVSGGTIVRWLRVHWWGKRRA